MTLTNYNAPKVRCTLIACQDTSSIPVSVTWLLKEIDFSLDLILLPRRKHKPTLLTFLSMSRGIMQVKDPTSHPNWVEFMVKG